MSWHRLVVRNDWESITVHIGGPVTGGRFGTNLDLKDCPPALKAQSYEVRWPDGHREVLPVTMKSYVSQVDDMGHSYSVTGHRPYFVYKHHGVPQEVKAEKLGVEVWRDAVGE